MTKYLFKLARRMASALAAASFTLLAACSEAAPRDFLGPDPTTPPPATGTVSLHIAPKVGAIPANQPLQFRAWGRTASGDSVAVAASWTASGGQIGADGVFRSAAGGSYSVQAFAVGKPHLTDAATVQVEAPASIFSGLQVGPAPAVVPMGGTLTFFAQAPLATGGMTVPSVTWTATGGTIAPNGVYSAGMAPGTFQVVASTVDGIHSDTVAVQVQAASLLSLAVTPKALTVSSGELVDFTAAGQWNDGSTSPPVVQWTSTAGAITAAGRLTAGGTPGVYKVIARHTPSARADTALVTIMPGVARIEVTPSSAELQPGAQKTFSAQAVRTDGAILPVAVTWASTGGVISTTGVYSAGSIPGSYRVIARYLGGVFADTALVTIAAPAATLTSLTVTPGTASVASGGQVSFNVVPTWSDGSSALPALAWTATGGSVTAGGTWTAPIAVGSYQVVVRHPGSGLADTATVAVTEGPRVTAVSITGQATGLQTGGTRQFSAQATWSDGASRPVEWLWSATGGTITVNGLYTAGSLAGQFMVILGCVGCSVTDTTDITVTSAPPPAATLTTLALNPAQALLNPGDVLPLHVSASWNDGSNQVPDLTWTVAGGTRSGLNYTAGPTAGTFLLIARHAAGTLADTTVITIDVPGAPSPGPTLTSLVLNPSSVSMIPGEQRTLSVAATWSDGNTTLPSLAWDVTGGTLSGLVYTAGSTAGSYRIIVRHQGGTRADTTAVTVVAGAAALQSLAITPNPASVTAGYSTAFTVTGLMSDGTTTTPSVNWSATGGTISSSGVFTAGSGTGTFQVSVAHAASGLSAQASVAITAPGAWVVNQPELPRHQVDISYPAMTGKSTHVASGGNLQAAINGASCGDEIVLSAGAVFTGNFTLPDKGCTSYIVIRGAGTTPPIGTRVTPSTATGFPKLMSPGNNLSPVEVKSGAGYYRLVGLEISAPVSVTGVNSLVRLDNKNALTFSQLPHHIVLDRVYIHGHSSLSLSRCVTMNSAWTAVVDSYLDDCHTKGSDSQAIVSWSGSGPFLIMNNYLAGAGENVMFGGARPTVENLVPSDIIVRGNHFTKPVAWKGLWTVKNLFEIKNAQRVLIEDNVFEHNWVDAQIGVAIVLKSSASGGGAPWTTAADITFRYNIVRHSPSAFTVSADPSSNEVIPTRRVRVEHNLFENIGSFNGTTGPYFSRLLGSGEGLKDIQIIHNTAVTGVTGSLMAFDGSSDSQRLVIQNNYFALGSYGIKGSSTPTGMASLNTFWSSHDVRGNILLAKSSAALGVYPANNHVVLDGSDVSGLMGLGGVQVGANQSIVLSRTASALSGQR